MLQLPFDETVGVGFAATAVLAFQLASDVGDAALQLQPGPLQLLPIPLERVCGELPLHVSQAPALLREVLVQNGDLSSGCVVTGHGGLAPPFEIRPPPCRERSVVVPWRVSEPAHAHVHD